MTENQAEDAKKDERKLSPIIGWTALFVLVVIILGAIASWCLGGESDSSEELLHATVRYADGVFTVNNHDEFAWSDVEFNLNYDASSPGYTYRADRLEARTAYTVGSMQFAESDGTMFNPVTQRPSKLSIRARTPDGEILYWYGSW